MTSPSLARRAWGLPLWAHAAAYLVVLVVLLVVLRPSSAFTSDEGAYAWQARHIADEGRWDVGYPFDDVDPDGEWFPLILSVESEKGWFPYPHHPVVPLTQAGLSRALGETAGFHLLSLLGGVGTAVAAWLVAGAVAPGARRVAFWLAAGGPVLVNAHLLWAHAPSAAVAGLTAWAALRALGSRRSWAWLAAVAAGSALGVLLRSEGLLFAGGAGVVLFLAALGGQWREWRGWRPAVAYGAVPVVAGLAAFVLERRWVAAIVGESYAGPDRTAGEGYLTGRIQGAWHELLAGSYLDATAGALALVALGALVLAFLGLRRGNAADVWRGGVLATIALLVRWATFPHDPVTGLLTAWPLLALGLAMAPWRATQWPARALGLGCLAFALAVLATQYPEGGGLEWGGRYLAPLSAPAAALAAAGLTARAAGRLAAPLIAVGAATAVLAVGTTAAIRWRHADQVAAVDRNISTAVVTDLPALPRLAWSVPEARWLLAEGEVDEAVRRLHRAGVRRVTVVTRGAAPEMAGVTTARAEEDALDIYVVAE